MTMPYDIARCTAMQQNGQPIAPCATCARHVQAHPIGSNTPWMTIPPAIWNGERYVCSQHLECAMNGYIVPGRARELFTPGDSLHLRKALVTARRVELGHAKTAVHHKDTAAQALATKQAELYSGLISKIDEAKK